MGQERSGNKARRTSWRNGRNFTIETNRAISGPYEVSRWTGDRELEIHKDGKLWEYNINRLTKVVE